MHGLSDLKDLRYTKKLSLAEWIGKLVCILFPVPPQSVKCKKLSYQLVNGIFPSPKAAAATEEPLRGGGEGRCGPLGPRKVEQTRFCIRTVPLRTAFYTVTTARQPAAAGWLLADSQSSYWCGSCADTNQLILCARLARLIRQPI
jgi:hypothetical protein